MSDYSDLELQEQLMNQLEEMQTEIERYRQTIADLQAEVSQKDSQALEAVEQAEIFSKELEKTQSELMNTKKKYSLALSNLEKLNSQLEQARQSANSSQVQELALTVQQQKKKIAEQAELIEKLNESDLELKKAEELNRSSEEILQRAEVVRKQYDRDSKRVEELRSELRELRIERENTAKKLQEDREELFLLNADKIHAEYEKCLTRAMRRILDSHACMIESRKTLFGGKAGEVLVDAEQLSELQDTARFWEGLQEQNRTLQEKLIRENNRCHDLETKLSVQADDIKRKRELIEELGELIMAEKGFTTNEEYVEWYLKNRNVSQN